jgi:signal transduction histidine kinase
VLVADDDPKGRELLAAILGTAGHQVVKAADGREALALLETTLVDVVVLDYLMPHLDGVETCRRIRRDPRHATLPVVFVTAQNDRASRIEGKQAGADDFLTKPFDAVELLVRIHNLLRVKAWYDLRERQREAAEEAVEQLKAQLLHVERLATLGTLAAGVGHELRNIATVLQGAWMFLQEQREAGQPPDVEDLQQLQAGIEHVAQHGRQLLALGRPGSAAVATLDLRRVVQGTLDLLRTAGRTRGLRIETDLPGDPAWVHANRTQVEQVLLNLLGNAIDALANVERDPRRILVAVRPAVGGRRMECAVSDNGAGMAPDVRARVFEPYFTTKPEWRGTGLGLPVVRQIVEAHGGHIRVESEPGCGTTMTFDLPAEATP